MANSSLLNSIAISAIFFTFVFAVALSPSAVDASIGIDDQFGWMTLAKAPAICMGSIGECMGGGEFEMDTESNRRILAASSYISDNSMKANNVPCDQRGQSYYSNCKAGAPANSYKRGCPTATHCSRG